MPREQLQSISLPAAKVFEVESELRRLRAQSTENREFNPENIEDWRYFIFQYLYDNKRIEPTDIRTKIRVKINLVLLGKENHETAEMLEDNFRAAWKQVERFIKDDKSKHVTQEHQTVVV